MTNYARPHQQNWRSTQPSSVGDGQSNTFCTPNHSPKPHPCQGRGSQESVNIGQFKGWMKQPMQLFSLVRTVSNVKDVFLLFCYRGRLERLYSTTRQMFCSQSFLTSYLSIISPHISFWQEQSEKYILHTPSSTQNYLPP